MPVLELETTAGRQVGASFLGGEVTARYLRQTPGSLSDWGLVAAQPATTWWTTDCNLCSFICCETF